LQLPDGRWASKLGEWEDIEHETPDDVRSKGNGQPRVFLRKRL
jgi:hypothetical protein